MNRDELPDLVQRFFADYLVNQRNLSAHTRNGYRDTFRLLLAFLSARNRRAIDQLTLDVVSPDSVLAFLDHLETARGNATRTRNLRLAAIRTFVRYVHGQRWRRVRRDRSQDSRDPAEESRQTDARVHDA